MTTVDIDPTPPPSSRQVEHVQESFARVAPAADAVGDAFYDRLFEIAPETRPLFPAELGPQKKKLMQMLGMAVGSLDRPDQVLPVLQELGARHEGYGVRDEHYDAVGAALLDTLEGGLGPAWTGDVRDAWVATWGLVATTMRSAQQAAAAGDPIHGLAP